MIRNINIQQRLVNELLDKCEYWGEIYEKKKKNWKDAKFYWKRYTYYFVTAKRLQMEVSVMIEEEEKKLGVQ